MISRNNNMNLRRQMFTLSLLGAFCATLLTAPYARAAGLKDTLNLIPKDAWAFMMLRSAETADKKIAELSKLLKLNFQGRLAPMLAGPPFNLGDAIDTKSPICLVMMDVQKAGNNPGQAIAVIVPANDPKALLKKIGAEEPKDGVCKCLLMGQASYAAIKDKFVIVGQNQDCVSQVSKAKKNVGEGFGETRLAALTKSDIYISLSIRAAITAYKDTFIMPFVQMMQATASPGSQDLQKAVKMFMEMTSVDVAMTMDKEGFSLRTLITPQADSDFEKWLKDTKSTSDSLLAILPKEKYLFTAGGLGGYSEHAEKFGSQSPLSAIIAAGQLTGVNEKAIKSIDDELLKMTKNTRASAISVSALPSGEHGMFGLTIAIEAKDPGEYLKGIRKVYNTLWTLSDDEDFGAIKELFAHTENAETIDGNKVDTITLKSKEFAELSELDDEDMKAMQTIFGKNLMVRFGAVGDKHFVFSFGGGKKRYEKICKAVLSSGDSLSDDKGIGALSNKLISPRSTEMYIAVDNILEAIKSVATLMGEEEEVDFEVPAINAPLAMGAAQLGNVMQVDIVVPMKLITSVKKLIDDIQKAEMEAFDEEEEEDEEEDEDEEEEEGEEEE